MVSYRESHTAEDTAKNYDKAIGSKFESRIYMIEDILFWKLLNKYAKKDSKILDFACWTGRKTSFLKEHYEDVRWFDISDAMLSVARQKYQNIDFYKVDLWKDKVDEKFDLITAFRFFLNAEDSLKKYILKNMRDILKDSWYIIFNIHYNKYSLACLLQRITYYLWMDKHKQNVVSYWQMEKILEECWYEIKESIWYSHLLGWSILRWLPFNFLKDIDLFLMKIDCIKYFAKDIMFVVKKI